METPINNLPIKIELPNNFLDEEIRSGYTVTTKMKKVWAVEIDLLHEFIRICDKYNLEWFADGGTMLGAVRHGGFIPWDDDIDVAMRREYYDNFCKVAKRELKEPYCFCDGVTEKGVLRGHAQIRNSLTTGILAYHKDQKQFRFNQGIFLDIFPMDNVPDDSLSFIKMRLNLAKQNECLQNLIQIRDLYQPKTGKGFLKYLRHLTKYALIKFLCDVLHVDKLLIKQYQHTFKLYKSTRTKRIANLSLFPYKETRLWQTKWYNYTINVPFEWFTIKVPTMFDNYLKQNYRNWHRFVLGGSLHGEVFFDPEHPFTNYISN